MNTTYNAFFFVTLAPWDERKQPDEKILAIFKNVNRQLAELPEAQAFLFPPPAIPGVGTSGGVSFVLEDRAGKDVAFLAEHTQKFIEAASNVQKLRGQHDLHPQRSPGFRKGGPG